MSVIKFPAPVPPAVPVDACLTPAWSRHIKWAALPGIAALFPVACFAAGY